MKSTTTAPRTNGRFVPQITDRQVLYLQDLVKSPKVATGHRINVRVALKRFVARDEASREIARLRRVVHA